MLRFMSRPVGRYIATGLTVHAAACVVFVGLAFTNLESCDRSDSLAAAWGLAVLVDIAVAAVVLIVTLRSAAGHRSQVLAGWAISFVPAIVVAAVEMAYVTSLPSGCA